MKPNEGLPFRVDPEAVTVILLKGDEMHRGYGGATLCPKCIQPLADYLKGLGITK
jgi:hypothetical protein